MEIEIIPCTNSRCVNGRTAYNQLCRTCYPHSSFPVMQQLILQEGSYDWKPLKRKYLKSARVLKQKNLIDVVEYTGTIYHIAGVYKKVKKQTYTYTT